MTQQSERPHRVSKKFNKMCEVYLLFSKAVEHILDFSEEMKLELFLSETYGDITCSPDNGYTYGKQHLNLTVTMWKEDVEKGLLQVSELYQPSEGETEFPRWWLDKVTKDMKCKDHWWVAAITKDTKYEGYGQNLNPEGWYTDPNTFEIKKREVA